MKNVKVLCPSWPKILHFLSFITLSVQSQNLFLSVFRVWLKKSDIFDIRPKMFIKQGQAKIVRSQGQIRTNSEKNFGLQTKKSDKLFARSPMASLNFNQSAAERSVGLFFFYLHVFYFFKRKSSNWANAPLPPPPGPENKINWTPPCSPVPPPPNVIRKILEVRWNFTMGRLPGSNFWLWRDWTKFQGLFLFKFSTGPKSRRTKKISKTTKKRKEKL